MPPLPTLSAARCSLRPWRRQNAPALCAIANTRDISWNTSHRFPYPFGQEEAARLLAHHGDESGEQMWAFAVEFQGRLVGGCGAHRNKGVQAHTATIGYWLGTDHWGKGIATEVVATLVEYMRTGTDVEQLIATCYAWNPASVRVLEKNGFHHEGTQRGAVKKWGKQTDLLLFGKLLG